MSMTAVISPTTTIPLYMPPTTVNIPTMASYIDRLMSILEEFESWQDSLSKKMFKWGSETLQPLLVINPIVNLNAFKQGVITRINILVHEILIYPLDKTHLVEPQLVKGRILEKRDLDVCIANGNKSPFDGSPLTYSPHTFAQKMLSWVRSLPAEVLPKEMGSQPIVASPSTAVLSMLQPTTVAVLSSNEEGSRLAAIVLLAQQSITLEKLNDRIIQVALESSAAAAASAELKAKAEKATIDLQKSAEKEKQAIQQQVVSLQQTYQSTNNSLEARLGDMSSRVTTLQKQLNTSTTVVSSQSSEIQQLRSNIGDLNRRINQMDRGGNDSCVIL